MIPHNSFASSPAHNAAGDKHTAVGVAAFGVLIPNDAHAILVPTRYGCESVRHPLDFCYIPFAVVVSTPGSRHGFPHGGKGQGSAVGWGERFPNGQAFVKESSVTAGSHPKHFTGIETVKFPSEISVMSLPTTGDTARQPQFIGIHAQFIAIAVLLLVRRLLCLHSPQGGDHGTIGIVHGENTLRFTKGSAHFLGFVHSITFPGKCHQFPAEGGDKARFPQFGNLSIPHESDSCVSPHFVVFAGQDEGHDLLVHPTDGRITDSLKQGIVFLPGKPPPPRMSTSASA